MQETEETRVRSLVQEDPLEEEMATHCGILAWKISSMDRGAWWPGVLRFMGSQRVGHDSATELNGTEPAVEELPLLHILANA